MSVVTKLKSFSIIGDSNVKRGMTPSNISGRLIMSEAQVIPGGGRLSTLSTALDSVRVESDACVVASITNILSSASGSSTSPGLRVEKFMSDFLGKVSSFCIKRPDVQVFILPPMYRTTPVWFREGMAEIMLKFSSMATDLKPRPYNLHLMASFAKPVLEQDGVHLTPYSGMEFVLHLFAEPERIMTSITSTPDAKAVLVDEEVRLIKDRVLVLEQDHRRLTEKSDRQFAIDQELSDFQQNIRDEIFFMISGLTRLQRLDPREWQQRAQADVNHVLSIMGFTHTARHVYNSTGQGKNSKVLYKVRVESVDISRAIRDKFGSYFAKGENTKPESLAHISIRNCVTTATLARIAIMQLLGRRYVSSNPGGRFQVIGFEPRPLLRLTPPPEAKDKRFMSFHYVEAVTKLPTCFTPDEISELLKRISPRLHSNLKALLIVVSEDMIKSKFTRQKSSKADDAPPQSDSSMTSPGSGDVSASGSRKRPARRSDGPSAKK